MVSTKHACARDATQVSVRLSQQRLQCFVVRQVKHGAVAARDVHNAVLGDVHLANARTNDERHTP